jgi:hypothetical protein
MTPFELTRGHEQRLRTFFSQLKQSRTAKKAA